MLDMSLFFVVAVHNSVRTQGPLLRGSFLKSAYSWIFKGFIERLKHTILREGLFVCFYFNFFEEGSHCKDQAELTVQHRLI